MNIVHQNNEYCVYSNKEISYSRLDEVNCIVVPHDIKKQCYIKTSIGYQTVIIDITRSEASELIQVPCKGINLKE